MAHSCPRVYVEEVTIAKTIAGVETSITAFVGRTMKGPTDEPILIHSFSEYDRIYGGLWSESNLSYAVYQYFQNGGKKAIIVRIAKGASEATFSSSKTELKLKAASSGMWGENLEIIIKNAEPTDLAEDPTCFDLVVRQKTGSPKKPGPILEMFQNVSLDPENPKYIERLLVDSGSSYLRVDGPVPSSNVPAPSDTDYQSNHTATDGSTLDSTTVIGDENSKTGLYALEKTDLFNLLCVPAFSEADNDRASVYAKALDLCNERRAILILDSPKGWLTKDDAKRNIDSFINRGRNAAIYFPHILAPDPLDYNRLRDFDPCGVVAGVIARTDAQRGVWKAPAGTEATLVGVPDLTVGLTNKENDELNQLGINCLRIFPTAEAVIWGSRTLRGKDRLDDEWKYLPVRRLALYIEESLYRGTQWAVFEPNDEKLWSQIRLNVSAFLHDLFTKGAFQGTAPKHAYFVKCDSETTTQYDTDNGFVNIIAGFAPLKPDEFIILKIQQIAEEGNMQIMKSKSG